MQTPFASVLCRIPACGGFVAWSWILLLSWCPFLVLLLCSRCYLLWPCRGQRWPPFSKSLRCVPRHRGNCDHVGFG